MTWSSFWFGSFFCGGWGEGLVLFFVSVPSIFPGAKRLLKMSFYSPSLSDRLQFCELGFSTSHRRP